MIESRRKIDLKAILLSPPVAAALFAVLIMTAALIIRPAAGMADNGDFERTINNCGLYKLDRYEEDRYFSYAANEFGIFEYYFERNDRPFRSQDIFIRAAILINNAVKGRSGSFDIRFLGGLLILYCAAAIYLLVEYASSGQKGRMAYITAALAVLIFADTGYTAYFNSFYPEGVVMISFLFMMASALHITKNLHSLKALLVSFTLNALIFITSGSEYVVPGSMAGLMLIVICLMMIKGEKEKESGAKRAGSPVSNTKAAVSSAGNAKRAAGDGSGGGSSSAPAGKWKGKGLKAGKGLKTAEAVNTGEAGDGDAYYKSRRSFLLTALACAALIILAGLTVKDDTSDYQKRVNAYHSMTRGVMMTSPDPERTLKSFGIDPQFAVLNGTVYFDRNPEITVESRLLEEDFFPKINRRSVSLYYLGHYGQFSSMLNTAANSAWHIQPDSLGNFDRKEGREPGAKTGFFTLAAVIKRDLMPKTFGFIMIWLALVLFFGLSDKKRLVITATAALMGLSVVFAAILRTGDANLSKQLFLFVVAFDFVTYVCGTAALNYIVRSRKGGKK